MVPKYPSLVHTVPYLPGQVTSNTDSTGKLHAFRAGFPALLRQASIPVEE